MAHFAKVNESNIVEQVIVVNNTELLDADGVEQESLGTSFCQNLFGGTWKQTSYNGNMRKNFAGIGYTYDSGRDAFIPSQPDGNYALDEATCLWVLVE